MFVLNLLVAANFPPSPPCCRLLFPATVSGCGVSSGIILYRFCPIPPFHKFKRFKAFMLMMPHPDWVTGYLKLISSLVALVPTDTEHSVIPQEPLGQTLSVMCQRAGSECLLVHRGACLADLKSQMRSHFGKNGKPSLWTRKATFLYMQWKPRKLWISAKQKEALERKEATPPSCHASAHHTSHKLHAPFH